jgi:hypothetical protein
MEQVKEITTIYISKTFLSEQWNPQMIILISVSSNQIRPIATLSVPLQLFVTSQHNPNNPTPQLQDAHTQTLKPTEICLLTRPCHFQIQA